MAKTTQVARQLGVTGSTVRNYAKAFAQFLSPGAAPSEGQRQFTDHDVAVLAVAREYLAQGMTYEQAADSLALTDLDSLDMDTVSPPTEPQPADEEPSPEPVTETRLTIHGQYQELIAYWQAEVERLQERNRQLEQDKSDLQAELLAEARKSWWQRLLGR